MYRVVVKSKKEEKIIVTWSRHEGIGNDRPFKLLARALCLLSYSHTQKKKRPKQPKPKFPTSPTLKRPIDP